jgi:hypothetical protein
MLQISKHGVFSLSLLGEKIISNRKKQQMLKGYFY